MVNMTDTVSQGKTYTQYPQKSHAASMKRGCNYLMKGVKLGRLQFGYLPPRWDKWTNKDCIHEVTYFWDTYICDVHVHVHIQ